ncbi:AAA family ATPase [Zhihengliuella sp. ISTPL4]|uniref:AAA family ATPase n=1 Tax=Zhihengliuella sp. ISTPL4 TaxID=2058657 RepID=UPI000C7A7C58|nr:AAA family ATPase [Zhihengliuella sp. ISTPL4]
MQLSKIEFNGFKRLDHTSCNVDGQTIAFIGPNEAGKSSVLRGLDWLTGDFDDPALPLRDQNRRKRPADDAMVVRAHYRLEADDIEALRQLDLDPDQPLSLKSVTQFRLNRRKDGQHVTGLESTLRRNPRPFEAASKHLATAASRIDAALEILEELEIDVPNDAIEAAEHSLDPADTPWTPQRIAPLRIAADGLRTLVSAIDQEDPKPRNLKALKTASLIAAGALQTAAVAGERAEPTEAIRAALRQRVPRFLLFGDDDRELSESYHLSDPTLRDNPPSPLLNLLSVAGTSVGDVWAATSGGDGASMRTLERRMNETLRERLQPMWTQSDLTIDLTLNQDGLLEVNILELDSPDYTVTPIAERSDGLRTFLGLVCFLVAADLDIPPVLLVDEAERNLHYDAQADLVRVLTRELKVHKVLYTTHSPGCLPLDLGTGIRVVSRDPSDPGTSRLDNNFWTNEHPGFSHLLFAMGAEAAAFSAFRRAVLAEGVSEMILLPTLLRNATDGSQLDFQVAFGLSNLSAPRAISSVALITAFLVDGDAAGRTKKKQLEREGVPVSHIFQLPKDKAIEDLIDRATYLQAVNGLLAEQGKSLSAQDLATDVTVAKAVDNYAKRHLGLPNGVSHKVVASRLASLGSDLRLNATGKRFLSDLRPKLEAAFKVHYTLTETASS